MEYQSIELRNYRRYADFSLALQPGINVIAGVNGSGKTSLLKAIRVTKHGLTDYLQISGPGRQAIEDDDARLEIVESEGRVRFERRYPVSVSARARQLDLDFEPRKRSDRRDRPRRTAGRPPQAPCCAATGTLV